MAESDLKLFAVIRTRGPAWNHSEPMEKQPDWNAHAAFMNMLEDEGFVILGGLLDGTPDVLLIMRAHSLEQIHSRLAEDPWAQNDLLRIKDIAPWSLRLGSLD